ncbi:hypothetical protein PS876_03237 [Pseudomonas fluorescens]|nr:hypothetical protein PS876_03237 [Pseudomonas fluorescens]
MFAAVGLDLAHQPRAVVVDVGFFGAIDVMHDDTAVVMPDVARVHLRERRPVPHATGSLASAFPLPEEARAARELALQDDVLIVVVVTLAVANSIGRLDQTLVGVVSITDEGVFGVPRLGKVQRRVKTLVINRDQMRPVITQQQRPTRAVVQTLNPILPIPNNAQTIAIGITDRRQTPGSKVIKPRRIPRQREDQFFRFIPEKNRRPRQAVMNRRALNTRQREPRTPVFMVNPDNTIAIELQSMRQRMAPAKPETDIDLGGTGAIQPGEFEWQQPVEHAIGQGQQFLAGDHRHRAAVFAGEWHTIGAVAVGVFCLVRGIVVVFVFFQHGVALGIPAQLHPAFFDTGGDPARGNSLVLINVLDETADDAEHRLDQPHQRRQQLNRVTCQT